MDDLILYVCHYGKELARRGIPVIFNACGTGLSCSPALRKQLAEALNLPNVVAVTCRDDVDLVNRWCGPGRAEPTDDPALWADQVYGVSRQTGSGVVGLGVMFPMSLDPRQTIRFWRKTVAALDRAGIPWKMFTNGSQRDMAFAGEIGSTDLLCPPPQSPRELVELVASFDAIVSFRLHSHVLAASLDVPSVAVAWDRKLPAFFEKTGHPERCLTIHASPEQVLLVLEQARQQGYDRQDLLHRREQARRNLNGQVREALSRNQKGAK